MPLPLLATKLKFPSPRDVLVDRRRLIEPMNANLARKLTLISAPAGFGKTTLATTWLRQLDLPVAWYSLDETDNDPAQFVAYLIRALQGVYPSLGADILLALQSPQPPEPAELIAQLINEASLQETTCLLALDDLHVIENEALWRAITLLVENLPQSLRLVVTTREDPPLPLSRLRARGELLEVRARDLQFNRSEADDFLMGVMGLELSSQQVTALEDRTEGWVAGLQLAAISLQSEPDKAAFIQAFSGSHRFILDYLTDEILRSLPVTIKTFLMETAALDELTAPLCDAVTGRSDSDALLAQIAQMNLFLIPLDDRRQWFRYHHLFREILHNQARQAPVEQTARLHARAAGWYEANDFVSAAVEHAFLASDLAYAAELIERHSLPALYRGEVRAVLTWFAALPEEHMRRHPMLWISKAWALALMERDVQIDAAEESLRNAERCIDAMQADEALRRTVFGHAASVRAFLLQSPLAPGHDPRRLIELAQRAQELLPEADQAIRSVNMLNMGYAYLELGDAQSAGEAFEQTYRLGLRGGNFYAAIYGPINRARIALDRGELPQAVAVCQQALDELHEMIPDADQQIPAIGGLYVVLGAAWYEQNRLDDAEQALTRGLNLVRWTGDYEMHMFGGATRARLRSYRGDAAGVEETLTELERSWSEGRFFTDALRIRLRLNSGSAEALQQARQWSEAVSAEARGLRIVEGLSPLDEARLYQAQTWLRAQIALSAADDCTSCLEDILGQVEALLASAVERGLVKFQVELAILKALTVAAIGRSAQAGEALQFAAQTAAPGGYMQAFLEERAHLAGLLREAAARAGNGGYMQAILTAYRREEAAPEAAASPGVYEALSAHEAAVLRWMGDGLTYDGIAEHMFISVNTVRYHVKGLYRKLGVSTRAEAIATGRELRLFDGNA